MPTRQDSPAHYLEQIQIAFNLLGRKNLPVMDKLGHLDLVRLLRSRIRFDLPGNRQLTMGVIKEDSPLVGKTIRMLYQQLSIHDFEIVAIMRREHVLLPHPDTLVEPKDRVILIASLPAQEALARHIAPIPEVEEGGMQAPMSDAA